MPLAICNMADTPEIESTAVLLRAAGYTDIRVCGSDLRDELKRAGLDTVLAVDHMMRLGYDALEPSITEATPADMERCDLFVEIKVRNVPKLWERWPRLKTKTLWKRVNGSQPEICPKGGDEVNLPCPVLTACLWYGTPRYSAGKLTQAQSSQEHEASRPVTEADLRQAALSIRYGDTGGLAYVYWPPYPRSAEYDAIDRGRTAFGRQSDVPLSPGPPFFICHSARAWGYGGIIDECVQLGVQMYGNNSPAGQISHRGVSRLTATGLALVHLKSVDCPGWALYEALLAGCPVVTGRLLNSRMLAYDLLVDGETCYEFGVPASLEYGRGDPDLPKCLADIKAAMVKLTDPKENRRIGENGRRRLNELMWTPARDGESFRAFMQRHFP